MEKLHALGEPKSLNRLRKTVEKMLPKIDLPDLLFEVHAWTSFLDAVVHLSDGKTRMKDLATSVVALLVSEVCNIGMTPVINPNIEALTRVRLVHVDQYYLRADTIFSELRGCGGSGGRWAGRGGPGGSAGDFGVELGELVLGGGEGDAESVDFAEPAFAFGFGDPRDEVDPDLFETGPLVRVDAEHCASDTGVLMDALTAE
ncbi:putative transposase [Streptomyces sp. NBRC 110611]|nr:Tn3 family transposase [Streptomyces sp. NBRC 110611]GAU71422.1 putative transposase [Streptomyces sp. NBRC 110611]